MNFLERNWPKHAFQFGGGGRPAVAQQIQQAPVPLPSPPVTQSNQAVIQAQHDIAQNNLLKKSVKKTVFAGDTGGYGAQGAQPFGGAMTPKK